jgi:arsenate reductase-like glutaredoxin family protein
LLAHEGAQVRERDFFKQRLGVEELRALLDGRPPGELFSWKSVLARQRGYQPGSLSDDEMLRLMAEEPTLIRRPFARAGTRLVMGFDEAALRELAQES